MTSLGNREKFAIDFEKGTVCAGHSPGHPNRQSPDDGVYESGSPGDYPSGG